MSHPAENDAWCLCGVVDDRGDGTCGNCGRPLLTDTSETDAALETVYYALLPLTSDHAWCEEAADAVVRALRDARIIPPASTEGDR